jgi:hypothetical protein
MTTRSEYFTTVADHDQVPEITVTQQDVDAAYGDPYQPRSISWYVNSEWARKFELFHQQHIVWVRSNNVLLLRFAYTYEVDLDRIKTEGNLLGWVSHLVGKPWMGPERTKMFIAAVCRIKRFGDIDRFC